MKQVLDKKRISLIIICSILFFSGLLYAAGFLIVGTTYQLDRAKFPGKCAICCTEDAMDKYIEAKEKNDKVTIKKMLFKIKTFDDITKMKKAHGCVLINSSSQATILKKGIISHQAKFSIFPFQHMWGYYLYFGGKIN